MVGREDWDPMDSNVSVAEQEQRVHWQNMVTRAPARRGPSDSDQRYRGSTKLTMRKKFTDPMACDAPEAPTAGGRLPEASCISA